MNQTFDHGRTGARMLSRPGFDLIMAVASARQAASPTTRLLHHQDGARSGRNGGAVRRALLGGGQILSRNETLCAARFFDASAAEPQDSVLLGEMVTEINDPFTRAFQRMLKPLDLEAAHQADGATSVESVME